MIPEQIIDAEGADAAVPGMKAVYTSADEPGPARPGTVVRAIDACMALNADAVTIESGDQVVVAVVNAYDKAYAAAVCSPGISLPVVARSLHLRLSDPAMPGRRSEVLPAATVRAIIGRWERMIAAVFGRRYAAGLVAAATSACAPGTMTGAEMEKVRRKLSSAIGDCIDLPE